MENKTCMEHWLLLEGVERLQSMRGSPIQWLQKRGCGGQPQLPNYAQIVVNSGVNDLTICISLLKRMKFTF